MDKLNVQEIIQALNNTILPIDVGIDGVIYTHMCTRNHDISTKPWLSRPINADYVFAEHDDSFEVYELIRQKPILIKHSDIWAYTTSLKNTNNLPLEKLYKINTCRWWEALKIRTDDFKNIWDGAKHLTKDQVDNALFSYMYEEDLNKLNIDDARQLVIDTYCNLISVESSIPEWILKYFYKIDITNNENDTLEKLKDMWNKKLKQANITEFNLSNLDTIDGVLSYWPGDHPPLFCYKHAKQVD